MWPPMSLTIPFGVTVVPEEVRIEHEGCWDRELHAVLPHIEFFVELG